jgi:myosin heavy subunit
VDDLILLDDISNEGILNTLRSRYNANLIYVRSLLLSLSLTQLSSSSLPLFFHLRVLTPFVRRVTRRFVQTYIGQVLIAINPYQQLPIYGPNVIKSYQVTHDTHTHTTHAHAVVWAAFSTLRAGLCHCSFLTHRRQ